jgi:hypothetical protein
MAHDDAAGTGVVESDPMSQNLSFSIDETGVTLRPTAPGSDFDTLPSNTVYGVDCPPKDSTFTLEGLPMPFGMGDTVDTTQRRGSAPELSGRFSRMQGQQGRCAKLLMSERSWEPWELCTPTNNLLSSPLRSPCVSPGTTACTRSTVSHTGWRWDASGAAG